MPAGRGLCSARCRGAPGVLTCTRTPTPGSDRPRAQLRGQGHLRGRGVLQERCVDSPPLPGRALVRTPGSPDSGAAFLQVGGLWRAGQPPSLHLHLR